jgi:hypothetical protein
MQKFLAVVLCALMLGPNSPVVRAIPLPDQEAEELVQKSYLDLLELEQFPTLSSDDIESAEEALKKEKSAEQSRLKEEEDRIGKDLKALRKRLEELNKKASRDDAAAAGERRDIQCEILRLEAERRRIKTEREKGVPVIYQNKFAKLDLIQRWPGIRRDIQETIASGKARERRYGDVEDIGIRDLGIEDLAEKQQQDTKMGQEAIREMRAQGLMPPEVEDKELTRYVERLAARIAENSDLRVPIKVTVLDSMEINAFALPGGFLFVNGPHQQSGNGVGACRRAGARDRACRCAPRRASDETVDDCERSLPGGADRGHHCHRRCSGAGHILRASVWFLRAGDDPESVAARCEPGL